MVWRCLRNQTYDGVLRSVETQDKGERRYAPKDAYVHLMARESGFVASGGIGGHILIQSREAKLVRWLASA